MATATASGGISGIAEVTCMGGGLLGSGARGRVRPRTLACPSMDDAAEPKTYRHGVRAVVPMAIAVGGFGVSFGVLARTAGMGILAPVVMSAITFAGSAQFAAVAILRDGGTVAAAITAAVLLNARYLPIG